VPARPARNLRIAKNLGNEPHPLVRLERLSRPLVVTDARAFLAAMLQGVKSVKSQDRRFRMAENGENTALVFGNKLSAHEVTDWNRDQLSFRHGQFQARSHESSKSAKLH